MRVKWRKKQSQSSRLKAKKSHFEPHQSHFWAAQSRFKAVLSRAKVAKGMLERCEVEKRCPKSPARGECQRHRRLDPPVKVGQTSRIKVGLQVVGNQWASNRVKPGQGYSSRFQPVNDGTYRYHGKILKGAAGQLDGRFGDRIDRLG
jgi:hypothetical protein